MGKSIAIIGLGGAGSNAINRIKAKSDAYCIRIDTDDAKNRETQLRSKADEQILLNPNAIGVNPSLSETEVYDIQRVLKEHKVIIMCVGLGGNTGSYIAPIVAKLANEQGKFVIAVMYKPFLFEGRKRSEIALDAVPNLQAESDYSVIIANEKLKQLGQVKSLLSAFSVADDIVVDVIETIEHVLQNHFTALGTTEASPLNSSKCLVCKSFVKDNISKCPVCGFGSASYEFINKEEADAWFNIHVIPARQAWKASHGNNNGGNITSLIEALNDTLSQNVIIDYYG